MRKLPEEQVRLTTQRLQLRPLSDSDIESIVTIHSDKDISKMLSDSIPYPYTEDDAVSFIDQSHKNYQERKSMDFAITLRDDQALIGVVGMELNPKNDHVTLGYWIGKAWWGEGYMSEAVSEVVRYCFEELDTHRVASHHFHPNIASGKVMQKAGLLYEGRRKEHYKKGDEFFDIIDYGVVKSEWEKGKKDMNYNQTKIDETVLATLLLTLHEENRAWKGCSFEVLDRLYQKGYIQNPKGKAKSVVLTQDGLAKAREVFDMLFTQ